MANIGNIQSKKQKLHIQKAAKYKKNHTVTKYVVFSISVVVFLASFLTMVRAFVEIGGTIATIGILIGFIIDCSNVFVESEIARDDFQKQQEKEVEKKYSEFYGLLPIPQSFVKYQKIIWAIRFFWILCIGFVIFMTSNNRNKANNGWIQTEITVLENQQISNNNITIQDEKSREKDSKRLKNELSLLRKEAVYLTNRWEHRDKWTKEQYYNKPFSDLSRQITEIDKELKGLTITKLSVTEIDNIKRRDARILELRQLQIDTEGQSDFDRNRDVIIHLMLMFISMFAIYFTTKETVRYLIHSGYYHKDELIKVEEKQKVIQESKTVLMREALQNVSIERKSKGGKTKITVSLSDLLGWKNSPKYNYLYKDTIKQIEQHYFVIEDRDGVNGICPQLKKR